MLGCFLFKKMSVLHGESKKKMQHYVVLLSNYQ